MEHLYHPEGQQTREMDVAQAPSQDGNAAPQASMWTRGEPGEVLEANKPLLAELKRLIKQRDREAVLAMIAKWPPAAVMEALIQLPLKRARKLYNWLPPGPAVKVLVEISPALRSVLMEETGISRIAAIVDGLSDDDAVVLLTDLPDDMVAELLPRLAHREGLAERLVYDEDSAGGIMSDQFVAVLEDWPIGVATRQIRRGAREIDKLYEVYVVDEERRLVGLLRLRDLLLNTKKTIVQDIMREVPATVHASADQEEVLELAERFRVQTIPVIDADQRVIGRITVDELRDVVRQEAEEDILLMSGVSSDAQADDTLARLVKGRLPWLVGGLLGASVAASVVGTFEEELAQAAILASFIPVVMAMAGNAGIQASTVTVQGLANGNLWIGDIGNRVLKELAGALVNGLVIALLLGVLILVASRLVDIAAPGHLALAVGGSLTIVIVMAATLGATIPLVLNHFKVDPAVATGVFITTTNDIFGVLIYFVMTTTFYLGSAVSV
ncbi:MAG: magnesium transporter [Pseudomonadota bacterium]